jgi:head-tail adaptor
MSAGLYRHRVTVQAPGAPAPDGDGGYTETWVDSVPPTWAVSIAPAPLGARDTPTAGTVLPLATHQVRGRYHAGVTTQARLLFGDRVLHVITVRNLEERQRTLDVLCSEVGA